MRNIILVFGLVVMPASAKTLYYNGYALSMPVLAGELAWEPSAAGYRIHIGTHPVGIAASLETSLSTWRATGSWGPDDDLRPVRPASYDAYSLRKAIYETVHIDYAANGSISGSFNQLTTGSQHRLGSAQNESVNPALYAHTIDGLSVIAGLLHGADPGAGCRGTSQYSDTLELAEVSWHLAGPEQLAASPYSTFVGTAIRCDFVIRQLAGFPITEDGTRKEEQPKSGSVWLARIDGITVPVRVALGPQDRVGALDVYLDLPAAAPGLPATPPPP